MPTAKELAEREGFEPSDPEAATALSWTATHECSLLGHKRESQGRLNGTLVTSIFPDRTASVDLADAAKLRTNHGVSFQGTIKTGPFEISGDQARVWIALPTNPNGARTQMFCFLGPMELI